MTRGGRPGPVQWDVARLPVSPDGEPDRVKVRMYQGDEVRPHVFWVCRSETMRAMARDILAVCDDVDGGVRGFLGRVLRAVGIW